MSSPLDTHLLHLKCQCWICFWKKHRKD